MSDSPNELRYTKTHEWVRLSDDNVVTVGITDHAQGALGDLVFVDLPEAGTDVAMDDEVGVIESVKTAADLYSPLTGEIVEVNAVLADNPAMVNQAPYSEGWLFRIKPNDVQQLDELMDAEEYQSMIEDED